MSPDLTVCVVDDDIAVLKGLTRLCNAWGCAVRSFATAQQFLDHLHTDGEDVICVVLDVHLPGMSGLDLQAELAQRRVPVPIIFVTGAGDNALRARALADGAIDFLEKPFDHTALLRALQEAWRRRDERLRSADQRQFLQVERHE